VALIDQIQQARETLEKLLTLYFSRHPSSATVLSLTSIGREGNTGEPAKLPGTSGKQIERCVISTFQVAESMGFKGEFRQGEHLLRIGE
jgi:hypothetical protein